MSTRKPDSAQKQLPLPSPRSPQALDQRILAEARANAPERRGNHSMAWGGGLATAAVLVVAVYITTLSDPPQPAAPPAEETALKEETLAAPATKPVARAKAQVSIAAEAAPQADPVEDRQEAADMAAAPPEARMAARAMPTAPPALPDSVQSALERLRDLLAEGEGERARREYSELRNSCSDCGLPDSLDQALAELGAQAGQPTPAE